MRRLKSWLPSFLAGIVGVVAGALLGARQHAEEPAAPPEIGPGPPPPDEDDVAAALGIHLPRPTIWPAVVGLGITLALAGVATSLVFTALGLLTLAWGIGGWIGDMRGEADGGHEHD